ncbi:MAG: CRISPR-associated endonuclease Cas2 [Candidatus Brachytrichaceae bacterium NZ_4S206]|jgi:CRISPR-associated protein Cas2
MFVVVSYDISDDRRRVKIMKLLKNFGAHVQESVFECDLKEDTYRAMRERLARLIAPDSDNIRFYFLDEDAVKKIETIGHLPVTRTQAWYWIG